jgi:hypothetical protein
MNVVNLSYTEHNEYYNLYLNNNEILNKIINTNIQNYNFEYNPEKYYQQNDNLNTRNIYENSGIIIMLNSIIQRNIYGYCLITKKKYLCKKMYFCDNLNNTKYYYYEYHFNCNSANYFIIHFSWEYFSPIYIYYPHINTIYNINYRYNNINNFVSYINSTPKNNFVNVKPNYMSYAIGIMHNSGHYFWNEIMGLMFIIENNLLDNIDEFLIYKYDYLNIGEILKNKYNKNVTYLNNDNNHNASCNVTKHFVNNYLVDTFKKFYELNDNICSNSNEINILFDIRSNSRLWLNQTENILNIIHRLKEKYVDYKINFYVSGFYKHEHNVFSNAYSYSEQVQKQNELFNSIQNNLDFKIFNLINMNLSELIKITEKIDFIIANLGSGIPFFHSIIFNKPVLGLTSKSCIIPFQSQLLTAFEHKVSNTTFLEHSDILYESYENFHISIESLFYKITTAVDKILICKYV